MLHVVTGPPCSGKSTYMRDRARDGDVLVDYDTIAQAFGRREPHQARRSLTDPSLAAFVARRAVVEWAICHVSDVEAWVIHTNPSPEDIDAYERVGAEIVEIDTDMETCLARAEADGRPPGTDEAIREWFANRDKAPKGAFLMPLRKGESMDIKTKTVEAEADVSGSISGYASTWTRTPDAYGDVVAEGAFAESIAAIAESGKAIPLLWNHDSGDLKAYIGTVTELTEDDHGLYFQADFDATPEAQRARELAMDGRLCKFSFAYDILDQGTVVLEDGTEANELRKLDIHEVSLVFYPANRDTSVVEVKSSGVSVPAKRDACDGIARLVQEATGLMVQRIDLKSEPDAVPEVTITALAPGGLKMGRRNSKADEEKLRKVLESCADIAEEIASIQFIVNGLLADEPADEQEPETKPDGGQANAEEPDGANAEEPGAGSAEVEALLKQAAEILEKEA